MVLYRKYRPQLLSELDLLETREKLAKTLKSSYRPHAYLFSGPKGTGKTSAARIVAKALNCVNPPAGGEPCNKCESCISITEGRHMDVIEIDAASNRGIDEMRDLREKIRLAPSTAKNKVYIIDEVHMLTTDAFNALLKTLEEPPEHAVFILATTEPDKLPDTILSRSTKFSFSKATNSEISHAIGRVVAGEKIKIEEDAINLIADYADGSFRDGTKILEQAINQKALSFAQVSEMLGWDSATAIDFLLLLKERNGKKLIEFIVNMGKRGSDFRFFVTEILNLLHLLVLENFEIKQTNFPEKLRGKFDIKEINSMVKLFSQVYSELKFAARGELPIETAVIEWCESGERRRYK